METNGKDVNSELIGSKNKGVVIMDSQNVVLNGQREEDDESAALLLPRRGGLSKKTVKPKRKVQWNDNNGNNLTEVLEFQPSDVSDSDNEDLDSCICSIM